jgi:hypothetical protein
MKKYKDDIKTIIEVLTFGLIYLVISTIQIPILSYLSLGIWICFLAYNLYFKIEYRKGKSTHVLFPTQNDQYSKTTSITLGLIVFVLSIIDILWTKIFYGYAIIGLPLGLIIFLNGIFDLPKGKIKIEGNTITISGLKTIFDQRQLKEINILKEHIILTSIYNEKQRVNNLTIDTKSAELIKNYILDNKNNNELTIINSVC